jgi:hypothetical protein
MKKLIPRLVPKLDGGPAFPTPNNGEWGFNSKDEKVFCPHVTPGMSLRDWFAGQALAGLLSSGHFTLPNDGDHAAWMTKHLGPEYDDQGKEKSPTRVVFDFPEAAWRCADSMLQRREEKAK